MSERIFVTHKLPGNYLDKLKSKYKVEVWPERDISRRDLLNKVRGVSGILSLLTERIDKEAIEAAGGNLRVISNYAVGYDNVDVGEATSKGIAVVNTPGVLTEAVAEHVIALTLAIARRVVEGDSFVRQGKFKGWEPDLLVGMGLRRKAMGVVGLGRIGRWVGRVATGIGMNVIYNSPSRDEEYELEYEAEYRSFRELLSSADVISLSVPLNEETRGLIGSSEFNLMKRTAILINTSRGSVVKEVDLIKALKERRIAGAGLDVFEDETNISRELRGLTNVVLTPHIASSTIEARYMMAKLAVEGLQSVLAGKMPENIVNKEVWEKRKLNKTSN